MNFLYKYYKEKIKWDLLEEYKYNCIMDIPYIIKVVVSTNFGKFFFDKKKIEIIMSDLFLITGQKCIYTKSKKSISNFKIREGDFIGIKVTLRSKIMYEFLDRLINIVIPRVKDFKGFSLLSFDSFGNYSFGIKEQIVFPEIDYNTVFLNGFNININIYSKTYKESFSLLKGFNFPFID